MFSRRSWFGVLMAGWLTPSLAGEGSQHWRGSLSQALSLLPSMRTGQQLVDKLGAPASREAFDHDDPGNKYYPNSYSRELRESGENETPAGLIAGLPVGTGLLLYKFKYGSALNPTGGVLSVCIDETDRIVGWMYSKSLTDHESEARLVR